MPSQKNILDKPKIIQTDTQLTAVIHLTIPRAEIQNVMSAAIAEVLAALAAQNIVASGACFSYHLRMPSDIFDFEVGFPVNQIISPSGRVKPSTLPTAKIARTVYHGGYEGLGVAWGEFCAWIESEGLSPQACLWECYLLGHETHDDPSTWKTELNRPLIS